MVLTTSTSTEDTTSIAESICKLLVLKCMKRSWNRFMRKLMYLGAVGFAIAVAVYIFKGIQYLLFPAKGGLIMRELRLFTTITVHRTSNRLSCHINSYPECVSEIFKVALSLIEIYVYDATAKAEGTDLEEVVNPVFIHQGLFFTASNGGGSLQDSLGNTEIDLCDAIENDTKKREEEKASTSTNTVERPLSSQLQSPCSSIYFPILYTHVPRTKTSGLVAFPERAVKSVIHEINKFCSLRKLTSTFMAFNREIGTENVRDVHLKVELLLDEFENRNFIPIDAKWRIAFEKSLSRKEFYSENKNFAAIKQREGTPLSRQNSSSSVLSQEPSTETSSLSRRSSSSSVWLADSEESEEKEDYRIKTYRRRKETINTYMATFPYCVVGPGPGKRLLHEISFSDKLEIKLQPSGYSPSNESDTDTSL